MRVNKIEKFVLELSDEEKEHLKSLLESSDLDDVVEVEEVEEEDEIDITFEDLNNIQEVIQNIEAELSDIKSTLGLE